MVYVNDYDSIKCFLVILSQNQVIVIGINSYLWDMLVVFSEVVDIKIGKGIKIDII